jgi:hypothetical protein
MLYRTASCCVKGDRVAAPDARAPHDTHDREHHRHFDKHADRSRERSLRPTESRTGQWLSPPQAQKIGRANQRRGTCYAPLDTERAVEAVSEASVEVDLNDDRRCEQQDYKRLMHDLRALQAEQKHKCQQECAEGQRRKAAQKICPRCWTALP